MVPQRALTTALVPFTHVWNVAYAKTPNGEPTMNVEATTFSFDFVMPKPLTKTETEGDNPQTSERAAQLTNARQDNHSDNDRAIIEFYSVWADACWDVRTDADLSS